MEGMVVDNQVQSTNIYKETGDKKEKQHQAEEQYM